MGCFGLGWVEQMLVNLIVLCAIIAILKLLVPLLVSLLTPLMGGGAVIVGKIITIVLWAIVAIFVVYIIFGLLSCLVGAGGFHVGAFR